MNSVCENCGILLGPGWVSGRPCPCCGFVSSSSMNSLLGHRNMLVQGNYLEQPRGTTSSDFRRDVGSASPLFEYGSWSPALAPKPAPVIREFALSLSQPLFEAHWPNLRPYISCEVSLSARDNHLILNMRGQPEQIEHAKSLVEATFGPVLAEQRFHFQAQQNQHNLMNQQQHQQQLQQQAILNPYDKITFGLSRGAHSSTTSLSGSSTSSNSNNNVADYFSNMDFQLDVVLYSKYIS